MAGSITAVRKRVGGGRDRRQLQLLLGAEMGEEAALAHPQLGREAADRQPLQALDGGEVDGAVENRRPRLLALAGGAGLAFDRGGHLLRVQEKHERSCKSLRMPPADGSMTRRN